MECEYIEDLGGSNFTGETTDDSDIYESDDEEDRVVESPLMRVIREESVDGGTLDVVVEGDKVLFREICGDIKELEVCGDLVGVSGVLKLRDVVECIIKGGDVVRLKECLGGFKVVKKALKFIIDINSIKI
jgi:hypothetical protein